MLEAEPAPERFSTKPSLFKTVMRDGCGTAKFLLRNPKNPSWIPSRLSLCASSKAPEITLKSSWFRKSAAFNGAQQRRGFHHSAHLNSSVGFSGD